MVTLKERTAIVTGGSSGLGFAIASEMMEAGMNVVILSVSNDHAAQAAKKLDESGSRCLGMQCDVSRSEEVKRSLEKTHQHFGSIDVIVNCAGIIDSYTISEMPEEFWDRVMEVNLKGAFLVVQHAIPYLESSTAPRIINISSNAGRMGGYENGLAYTASKGGLIAMTYGLARRLADKGITVNCVAPGTIQTGMSDVYDEAAKKRLTERVPMGRLGSPADVAAAVCYFASEESSFTTGSVLDVNGGMFMG